MMPSLANNKAVSLHFFILVAMFDVLTPSVSSTKDYCSDGCTCGSLASFRSGVKWQTPILGSPRAQDNFIRAWKPRSEEALVLSRRQGGMERLRCDGIAS